ncbi:MAG: YceI family protein [Bacteroidetes bacterium]|nr:YceI family protein [Bacteroidota bacterium]
MKQIMLAATAALLMIAGNAAAKKSPEKTPKSVATKWKADVTHSSVKFTVTHLTVSEVEGKFKVFNGTIDAQTADFNNAKVEFSVDVNSINTDDENRDKHLKSDDFFNAEKFPAMRFTSTAFRKVKGNIYYLEGNLTIRDVTKKAKFAVLYGGTVKDPYGNIKAGFKATSKISRKEYGLKWNKLTEMGGAVVGDEVNIILNIEFAKQQ